MLDSDSLAKLWCEDFSNYRIGDAGELKHSDEMLMDLTYRDIQSALAVVLEISRKIRNQEALDYLAAQHFEEICAEGTPELILNLNDDQRAAAKRLIPYIWQRRFSDDMRETLVKLASDNL